MKKILMTFSIIIFASIAAISNKYSPYFSLGTLEGSIDAQVENIKKALSTQKFRVIGEYSVGNSDNLYVVCYTRNDLERITLDFTDRGALAASLKIGFKKEGTSVTVTMINPMYLFYAYLIEDIAKYENDLQKISNDAKLAIQSIRKELTPFGGELTKEKLQKYHYKIMMPYFKDAENLKTYSSYEEGLEIIQNNLNAGKGQTKKVYELIYSDKKVAVFGVGLMNTEKGESHFLPIIGEDHVSAMPYELILQGNEATILPGRYRIALHWPELTMGTFMKIMSTPGDIAKTLKSLTE